MQARPAGSGSRPGLLLAEWRGRRSGDPLLIEAIFLGIYLPVRPGFVAINQTVKLAAIEGVFPTARAWH